jgi:hypothetical protein
VVRGVGKFLDEGKDLYECFVDFSDWFQKD